jgi:hypothetical protein
MGPLGGINTLLLLAATRWSLWSQQNWNKWRTWEEEHEEYLPPPDKFMEPPGEEHEESWSQPVQLRSSADFWEEAIANSSGETQSAFNMIHLSQRGRNNDWKLEI